MAAREFNVRITLYTKEAERKLPDPDTVRHMIGSALDQLAGLEEEIDYVLSVKRVHTQANLRIVE